MVTARQVSLWLAPFSVIALVLMFLALQDIYHQEADLRLEWNMVRVAIPILAAFHVAAVRALKAK